MTAQEIIHKTAEACIPGRIRLRIEKMCREGLVDVEGLSEIRLRAGRPSSVTVFGSNIIIDEVLGEAELYDCLASLCRGSVYAYADTAKEGYICGGGGIRVGVCGTFAPDGRGVREITSLNIRIPRAVRNICGGILGMCFDGQTVSSVLIYSPPGIGKTTLLRDIAATLGGQYKKRTAVIDTRGELYMDEMFRGTVCDILAGYPRPKGIEIATRTLYPEVVICDEIGDTDEARGIIAAQNTGVPIIATAHGSCVEGLLLRPGIKMLHDAHVFSGYIGIERESVNRRFSGHFTHKFTSWEEADILR